MNHFDVQAVWEMYQQGIAYKSEIGLYDTVARNERFFAGDQWAGVHAPDLPRPVVNFLKRACQQRVAQVKANPVTIRFEPVAFPGPGEQPVTDEALAKGTEILNAVFEADWERLKMDAVNLDGLEDACISGDYLLYNYWDGEAPTGQAAKGRIRVESIDNVNFYPADPNDRRVQEQSHILIARREFAADVRAQAKAAGRPTTEIALIGADGETQYQSGDLSRAEPNGKCVTLLLLWRDAATGHIFAQKSAREALIRPQWDTRLTRYPLALMNWENRKNCCHGRAEITGLVPVQRYVNQMYALMMLYTMQSACPKPLFNQGMIEAWSTAVGAAIPVNGDVNAAARYLEPPALPQDASQLPERLMENILKLLGVTQIELGDLNPTNMSAMTLAQQAASLPVETIRTRFYAMLEDFARNWLDMTLAFATVPRWERAAGGPLLFDAQALRENLWSVKIEVGPAELFSEIGSMQALSALYSSGGISARQYIERLPDGYLPNRAQLLKELTQQAAHAEKGVSGMQMR